jgi:LysM repeat protein
VRNDPWLQAKLKDIDSEQRKLSDLPLAVSELRDEVDALTDAVERVRTASGAGASEQLLNQVNSLNQKVLAIEKRLSAIESNVQDLSKKVAAAGARPTTLRVTPPEKTATPSSSTPSATSPKPGPSPTETAKKPAPTPEPEKPKGFYYTASKGDTAASVAKRHDISVEALIEKNTYLKPDSNLVPGQRYWIPAAPK